RPFSGFVEAEPYLDFDDWGTRWLSDEDGNSVPFQEVQPESSQLIPRILFPAEIAAGASRQFRVRDDALPPVAGQDDGLLVATTDRLSNGLVEVRLRRGGIA